MEIDWIVIVIVGIFALLLLYFLVRKNQKDEKELEKDWNSTKPERSESELNNDNDDY